VTWVRVVPDPDYMVIRNEGDTVRVHRMAPGWYRRFERKGRDEWLWRDVMRVDDREAARVAKNGASAGANQPGGRGGTD
jgi:hypothetical protein